MQIQPPKSIYLLLIDPAPPLHFVSGRRRGFEIQFRGERSGSLTVNLTKLDIQDTVGVVSKMDQKSQFLTILPSRTIICTHRDMRGQFFDVI